MCGLDIDELDVEPAAGIRAGLTCPIGLAIDETPGRQGRGLHGRICAARLKRCPHTSPGGKETHVKPTTGPVRVVPPDPDAPPTDNGPRQLVLRLLAWVEGCTGVPPDRALWRELIDLALDNAPTSVFVVYGRRVSAAIVHHVALVIYTLTDRAGIAHVTDAQIAAHAHREPKVVAKAIAVLNRIRAIRTTRDNRRGARFHAMNLGGLSWPAIRRRAKLHPTHEPVDPSLPLEPSGVHSTPLSGVHSTPLLGDVRTGQISRAKAAAGTPRTRETDQEQQPGRTARIEGLIGAIAARSRSLARPFDEGQARQDLARGERTIDDLQRQADELDRDCLARPFTDPATGRHVQRNPEAIAASVEHQRRLAADEGRPFDEAAARLEAERADDRHLAQCLALGDGRQERAGEDGD